MEEAGNGKTAPDLPIYHWTKFFYSYPPTAARRNPQRTRRETATI